MFMLIRKHTLGFGQHCEIRTFFAIQCVCTKSRGGGTLIRIKEHSVTYTCGETNLIFFFGAVHRH